MSTGGSCPQSGCEGTIDGGYCDTCGLAPAPGPGDGTPSGQAAGIIAVGTVAATQDGGSCPQSGCEGTIDGGYCDTCGLAPAGATAFPGAAEPSLGSAGTRSMATGSRSRTGSVSTPGSRTGSRASRRAPGSSSRSTSRSSRLGAGLVDMPLVPRVDPASALLADPQVAERNRFCHKCGNPVGRSRDGRPGRTEGFCPRDGTRFSFVPTLTRGTLVAGQYQVQGCLAHGGLGWIYLATDRNVEDRWVVLKGLLDTGDKAARAASAAERRFLAEVNHPNIVTIHNFVEHPGADGAPVGYIVMEYVGGSSLRALVEERGRREGKPRNQIAPLPLPQVISYGLEILPALGYLHGMGLAYCDLKPDNLIQYERQLKLIDMGAVVPFDEADSFDWYGTPGYQAPEFEKDGPSPAADIYTVGRTLAVLALGLVPQRRGVPEPLPGPSDTPLLAENESFHRLLVRATDPDPLRRFASADEMTEQLSGVLREVLAAEDGQPRPGRSTIFGPPQAVFGAGLLGAAGRTGRPDPAAVAAALPVPLVDTADPAAGLLATASSAAPADILRMAETQTRASGQPPSTELRLRVVRARLEAGDVATARAELDVLSIDLPGDWRPDWFRALAALVAGEPQLATRFFDTVLATVPGELAPKLGLAAAAECAGDDDAAGWYYLQAGRPAPEISDTAFGRARVALRAGRNSDALAALDTIAPTSSQYVTAQIVAVRVAIGEGSGAVVPEADLRAAADRIGTLTLDPRTRHDIRASLFDAALPLVTGARPDAPKRPLLGCRWSEPDLRLALEAELLAEAGHTADEDRRIDLVDRANAVRPPSWV